jgi:hypothetical protein
LIYCEQIKSISQCIHKEEIMELLIIKVFCFSISLVTGTCYAKQKKRGIALAWYVGTFFWFVSLIPDFLSFTYPW